ncbi:retrotransposon hot spot (RHS) protein, putative, partial [Trypanosoma cruzi]
RTGVVMAPCSSSSAVSDAAARRGVEGTRRPEWTMNSRVEEILLGGSTSRTDISDMKLNDFLRSYLGEEWILDTNENVTMGNFVQDPEMFFQNEILLRTIKASPSYKVLEAINKLHPEGVFSLEQWRDYEGKDTITPFPRGKLNAVLSQVQKEIIEAEERLRRAQEMKFTISANIEDVLFRGEFRVNEKKLNDFLLLRFGGKGVVATNRSVLLEEFFKDPARYIRDAGVLNEIKTTHCYWSMEWTVKDEMVFDEDVRKLRYNHVISLLGWSLATPEVKEIVHNFTKQSLDAALEEARKPKKSSAPEKLEGFYKSVYNAMWHHVVEVPDGEG